MSDSPALSAFAGGERRARRERGPHRRARTGGIEIDPDAAAEVRRAFDLVRDGSTVRDAASRLGWHPTMLARVLKRVEYKMAGEWRIIDPRIWNDAQAALARRRKRAA